MEQIAANKSFGGQQLQFRHRSSACHCDMEFSIYLPPQAENGKVPVLYWLSGITCTDQNFVIKAGAQQYAAKHGLAIVAPDTSPRGEAVPGDPHGEIYFGHGAGFYVNATQEPWSEHYNMYNYVTSELPDLVNDQFPIDPSRESIAGHSMGGHGALVVGLRNYDRFKSISAFAPLSSPSESPWGRRALTLYLGENEADWEQYNSCELVRKAGQHLPILVDQGAADPVLEDQLRTDLLVKAAEESGYPIRIRYQEGYDHSYFFVASFIEEHIAFHAEHLKG